MEEVNKTNAGQGLGVAGFILGIIGLIVALIPCVGLLALILSITGIVLSAVALNQSSRGNGQKGLIMAALVISILATLLAVSWNVFIVDRIKHGVHNHFERTMNDEFGKDVDKAAGEVGKDMEEALKNLEAGTSDSISDKDFDKLLDEYQDLTKDYIDLMNKAQKGDMNSIAASTKVATKAVSLAAKLSTASLRFSDEQRKKFDDIQKQYEEAVKKAEKK